MVNKTSRIINGHRFYKTGTIYLSKRDAEAQAKKQRKQGHKVRIVTTKQGRPEAPPSMKRYQLLVSV